MNFLRGRPAIGRNILAAAVVLLVVLVATVAVFSGALHAASSSTSTTSSSTAAQTTASQTTSSTANQTSTSQTSSFSAGLDITNMYADVLSGSYQAPTRNSTTINDNQTTYVASVGVTFSVDINIEYDNCTAKCPAAIATAFVAPSNFYVQSITVIPPTSGAGLPAAVMQTNDGQEHCHFIITITAPMTPYTGPLTVTMQPGSVTM